MAEGINFHYDVDGSDFTSAGKASVQIKKSLQLLGIDAEIIRRVSIAMYEGEINMVIHANGGVADVEISPEQIRVVLTDNGPGIQDIPLAMTEGYSTASDNVRELGFGAGMGLPNMKKYTDELNIETTIGKGTVVEMIINTVNEARV